MTDLAEVDIAAGWDMLKAERSASYKHYRPLLEAATDIVTEIQDSRRIYTGFPEIDAEMRGFGASHFFVIQGFSHGGKTLAWTHMMRANKRAKSILYTPDEPSTLILAKLASLEFGIDGKELEQRIADDDRAAIRILHDTIEEFPNLIVYEDGLDAYDMEVAYEEACDVWGAEPDFISYDFLEQLPYGETVKQKAGWLKAFGKRHRVPMCVLHQVSRSAGADGQKLDISSGAYGGEQEATFQLSVRRKKYAIMAEIGELEVKIMRTGKESDRERLDSLRYELGIHEHTVSISLTKNKRIGGDLVDEVDYELDRATGRLWPIRHQELPKGYLQAVREPEFHDDDDYEQQEMW